MAINPEEINIIEPKQLVSAMGLNTSFFLIVQDPAGGSKVTKIQISDLLALAVGESILPNGILNGLEVQIDNEADPRVITVFPGQWRINGIVYTLSSPYYIPVNAPDVTDRTDIIYLSDQDESDAIIYEPGSNILPAGNLLLRLFTVKSNGDDIDIPELTPETKFVVLNTINDGSINITGQFMINGVPISGGDSAAPAFKVYGSVPFGKYSNGETVPAAPSAFEQYREAWTDIAPPTYLAPTASLTATPATTGLEIGQEVNVDLTLSYNQRDGGEETARVINKNGTPLVGTTDTIVISNTPVNYQGNISYGQGAVKDNAAGIPDPTGRIEAGNVNSNTISYRGDYPLFATTANIITATKQPLVNMNTANNVHISLVAESGGNKQFFEIPDAWLALRPLVYVQYFNTVSNQFDTANKISDFAVNSVNETIQGNTVGYKRYTYTGADRANILIRLGF